MVSALSSEDLLYSFSLECLGNHLTHFQVHLRGVRRIALCKLADDRMHGQIEKKELFMTCFLKGKPMMRLITLGLLMRNFFIIKGFMK